MVNAPIGKDSGMMSGPFSTLLSYGPIAGIIALWSQVQGLIQRFYSIFFVTFTVRHDASDKLFMYLTDKGAQLRLGARDFRLHDVYIKSQKRLGKVYFETNAGNLTFRFGWKFIFTSKNNDDMSVTFLRGTFKTEDLLRDALEHSDSRNVSKKGLQCGRFRIVKLYGTSTHKQQEQPAIADDRAHGLQADKPVGYNRDELGLPVPESPFEGLHYGPEVKAFIEEFDFWYNSREWYRARMLDWRFGGLFAGEPGTGKTSLIRALAQEYNMPIFYLDLPSMTNRDLNEAWNQVRLHTPCIALFEDMDRMFDKDKKLIQRNVGVEGITLNALLNCIQGVEEAEGIVTIVTANDISNLDPALGVPDANQKSTRPGRLDRYVFFAPLDISGRRKLAKRILDGAPVDIEDIVQQGAGETGVKFIRRCQVLAEEHYWKQYRERRENVRGK